MTRDGAARPTGILATGSYVPKQEVTNEEVAARVGVDPQWIADRTQITGRRWAAPDEAASDLAVQAGLRALEAAGVAAGEVDYLIVSTGTGDSPQPPTSYLVQDGIGARDAACFDISVACSGFVYGIELARALLLDRPDGIALVIAAEVYSRFADFSDRRTCVLLGDGAGAAVIGAVEAPHGVLAVDLVSRGDAHELIRVEGGGSRRPASHETVRDRAHTVSMDGRGVTEFVLAEVPAVLERVARRAGVELSDVDHFVPHQPNGVLLGRLSEAAGLSRARTHRTVERYGNMGSASVAVTLAEAAPDLAPGDLVLIAGFGGGMAVGATVVHWGVGA
ncbi:3-oxoacyl-ACP synthase III family protein [Spirillospora albida]|uniref:3-oxoacyl-ACP synthase III family protein n=1 Tax=Spirillospora albida TaxID=58123 RepID=UPI0004C0A502|nr:ketoacyl-ACP synthase III [Spirillospora albida]